MAYVSATKGPISGGSACLAASEEVRNSLSGLSERGTREAGRERPTVMSAVLRWEDTAGHRSRTLRLAGLPCGRCPHMGQSWQDWVPGASPGRGSPEGPHGSGPLFHRSPLPEGSREASPSPRTHPWVHSQSQGTCLKEEKLVSFCNTARPQCKL